MNNRPRPIKPQKPRSWLKTVLFVQFCLLTVNNALTAPGWDEWGHLPSGLYHLQFGEYRPSCVNPPLVRSVAAIPVWLVGGGFDKQISNEFLGYRPERALANRFFNQHGLWVFLYFFLAREMLVPVTLFGTWLLFSVCRDLYGEIGANTAISLWTFSPMVLTYGPSLVPDQSAMVAGLWCIVSFRAWLDQKTLSSVLKVGFTLFLSLASKFTWVVMPVLLIAIWLVDSRCFVKQRMAWRSDAKQIVAAALLCLFLLNLLYEFSGTGKQLREFQFASETLSGLGHDGKTLQFGNKFENSWWGILPVPVPSAMLEGIDIQRRDFESELDSYLFGKRQNRGWIHYYIVGMFLKEPVAIWLLFGGWFFLGRDKSLNWSKQEVYTFIPGVAVFVLVSSQTGFNHHLRYVLPAFLVLYILAAKAASVLWNLPWGKGLVVIFLSWYCASSLLLVPRSYAYFSEAIGGSSNGWRYMDNSNLDWGQDLYTALMWVYQNPDSGPFYVLYSLPQAQIESVVPSLYDGRNHLETQLGESSFVPAKSGTWIVFSQILTQPEGTWFRNKTPEFELSPTIRVYRVDVASKLSHAQDGEKIE